MCPVLTGTAANCIGLAALVPAWRSILCHPDSHINTDECGAPEALAGVKLITAPPEQEFKIDPVVVPKYRLATDVWKADLKTRSRLSRQSLVAFRWESLVPVASLDGGDGTSGSRWRSCLLDNVLPHHRVLSLSKALDSPVNPSSFSTLRTAACFNPSFRSPPSNPPPQSHACAYQIAPCSLVQSRPRT